MEKNIENKKMIRFSEWVKLKERKHHVSKDDNKKVVHHKKHGG